MRLSLSTISTLNASFAEDVAAYAEAGFDAIGLWEFKLPEDDVANIALLRAAGLSVSNCIPTVPSFLQLAIPGMEGPADPEQRVEAICTSIRRLAAYDPGCVLCLSGPLGGRAEAEGRELVVAGLRRVADAARQAGVRLGFEPIHPAQRDAAGFVTSLADALALLDEADAVDVGIMADTFNLGHEPTDALVRVVPRLTGVHVADELPRAAARRACPARARGPLGGDRRRAPRRRLGRHAGCRDLLDARRLLGASRGRGRAARPRCRRRAARRVARRRAMDLDAASIPLRELDRLWDFDDPAASERRFAELVERAGNEHDGAFLTEVLTQLARAQGLQRRFDDARRTLVEADRALRPGDRRGHVRLLLERGRVDRSEKRDDLGRGAFLDAWELARAAGEDGLAVDAAHMLGIIEPPEIAREWNERAMELARASADPVARRWVGSLANNIGWARYEVGDLDGAIALFEQSRDAFLSDRRDDRARVARWSIARCLRSRSDVADALDEQEALLAELDALGQTDGYVLEEIAECLLALGRADEARPFFARAYAELCVDPRLRADEPERLKRLESLGHG